MGKEWRNKVWGKCEKAKSGKNVKNSCGKNSPWKNVDKWLGGGEKGGKMSVWKKAWKNSAEKYYISSCVGDALELLEVRIGHMATLTNPQDGELIIWLCLLLIFIRRHP